MKLTEPGTGWAVSILVGNWTNLRSFPAYLILYVVHYTNMHFVVVIVVVGYIHTFRTRSQ